MYPVNRPADFRGPGIRVDADDFEKVKGVLEKDGYFESASPWTFRSVTIELHRFLKEKANKPVDLPPAPPEAGKPTSFGSGAGRRPAR
jgi:hypothetical protein